MAWWKTILKPYQNTSNIISILCSSQLPVSVASEVADALTDCRWQFVVRQIDLLSLVRICQGIK